MKRVADPWDPNCFEAEGEERELMPRAWVVTGTDVPALPEVSWFRLTVEAENSNRAIEKVRDLRRQAGRGDVRISAVRRVGVRR